MVLGMSARGLKADLSQQVAAGHQRKLRIPLRIGEQMPVRVERKLDVFVPDPDLEPLQVDLAGDPAARRRVTKRVEAIFAGQDRLTVLVTDYPALPVSLRRSQPRPHLQGKIRAPEEVVVPEWRACRAGEREVLLGMRAAKLPPLWL